MLKYGDIFSIAYPIILNVRKYQEWGISPWTRIISRTIFQMMDDEEARQAV